MACMRDTCHAGMSDIPTSWSRRERANSPTICSAVPFERAIRAGSLPAGAPYLNPR